MYGYAGKILYVDLSTGEIKAEKLSRKLIEGFLGGAGINAKLAYDLIPPGTDPLGVDNKIIIGAGPLVGTFAPGTPKVMAITKLPQTNTFATCSGGGAFGRALKYAGYDHLVIYGRADRPSYLEIIDDSVEIRSAEDIWGKTLDEATKYLWRRYGKYGYGTCCSVLCIGPAGEKMVKYALTFIDEFWHLGRGGLGAVMGSKNLKAIVVRGTKGVRVADPNKFMKIAKSMLERIKRDPIREDFTKYGILVGWEEWAKAGQIFVKNFREALPSKVAVEVFGPKPYISLKKAAVACPSCQEGCKAIMEIKEGPYAGLVVPVADAMAGNLTTGCKIEDGDLVKGLVAYWEAKRYGIDMFDAAGLMEYLSELYERGFVDEEKLGFVPERTLECFLKIIRDVSERRGFGDVMADGWERLFEELGSETRKYAVLYKGATPVFDPRAILGSEAFGEITNPRGHEGPVSITVIPGRSPQTIARYMKRIGAPDDAIERAFANNRFNVAVYTKYTEDWLYALDCLGVCRREGVVRFYTIETCAELYSAATGIDVSPQDVRRAGEKVWNLERAHNLLEGFTAEQLEAVPDRVFEPLLFEGKELRIRDYFGKEAISREKLKQLIRDYYRERGWNPDTGVPTREKLTELGLEDVARDLAERGLM